jgi:phospholipid-binding lipoprotein MlaA
LKKPAPLFPAVLGRVPRLPFPRPHGRLYRDCAYPLALAHPPGVETDPQGADKQEKGKPTPGMHRTRPIFRWLFLCPFVLLVSCAGVKPADNSIETAGAPVPAPTAREEEGTSDPLEGFNRAMYTFNEKLDDYVLKPLATGYRAVVPELARRGVSNFFSNLREPAVFVNDLLQAKIARALSDLTRFLVNSTIGIYGVFDVATAMGLEKHDEDFGQTLAVWGVGEGPYLVLPFFGPSNFRDGSALIVDYELYPPNHMEEKSTRNKLFVAEAISRRAQLLDASDILEQAAGQDPYVFIREAYRSRRRYLVYDGNPPEAPPDPYLFEDDKPPTGRAAPAQEGAPSR